MNFDVMGLKILKTVESHYIEMTSQNILHQDIQKISKKHQNSFLAIYPKKIAIKKDNKVYYIYFLKLNVIKGEHFYFIKFLFLYFVT